LRQCARPALRTRRRRRREMVRAASSAPTGTLPLSPFPLSPVPLGPVPLSPVSAVRAADRRLRLHELNRMARNGYCAAMGYPPTHPHLRQAEACLVVACRIRWASKHARPVLGAGYHAAWDTGANRRGWRRQALCQPTGCAAPGGGRPTRLQGERGPHVQREIHEDVGEAGRDVGRLCETYKALRDSAYAGCYKL